MPYARTLYQATDPPKATYALLIGMCLSVLLLLTLGFVMLSSTGSSKAFLEGGDAFCHTKRQAMWLGIGLAACAIMARVNYRHYRQWAWPIFIAACLLLVGVLVFGRRINGATRWFVLGPVRFQPSEFAKYAQVIVLAYWLEKMQRAPRARLQPRIFHWWWGVFAPLAITCGPGALILKEPDLGTTALLIGVSLVLMWLAGSPSAWLAGLVGAGVLGIVAGLVAIFKFGMFQDYYQVQRIIHWWLEDDLSGTNYQQFIAKLALGSGGILGVGLSNSRMKLGFLPETHTDFILPIIGEELGLIATLAIVLAFAILVIGGLILAARAPDLFGALLASGIIAVIGMQAILNIAVVTNTIPNKGLALPFVSYGGSNMVMTLSALGVFLNIAREIGTQAPGEIDNGELS